MIPLVPAWRVDRTFDYAVPETLASSIELGSLVRVRFGNRRVRGIVVGLDEGSTEGLESAISKVVEPSLADPSALDLLEFVARRYVAPRGRVYDRVVPPRVRVRPQASDVMPTDADPSVLNDFQGARELIARIEDGGAGTSLLRPTPPHPRGPLIEVLVSAALRGERSALVLVPEVRYGSHVIEAMQHAFPGLARVDSSVPEPARTAAWLAAASGARLCVGGRGAVLAPMKDLGLIVVDDAHARTYKEDRSPRFDAVTVARERARLTGAACVLITSTPPLELSGGAAGRGITVVKPLRASERAARPVVQLAEPPEVGLSHELHVAVRETLRAGGKVGLLAPLPGFARALWCSDCRRSVRCGRCEAGLVYERGPRSTRCPRCSDRRPAPDVCPTCASPDLKMLGAGSERLADQVAKSFPRARLQRMDPQVLSEGGGGQDPDADIYLTTWIGVKGSLRPVVSTVGVLDADTWIRRPDFRAAEQAYMALSEMAAWAGPSSEGGRLMIQTTEPGHHSVQAVVRGDPGFFLERELEHRKELAYPPFSELVKVTAEGPDDEGLLTEIRGAAGAAGAKVLGPVPVRIGERVGRQLLLKCPDASRVAEQLRVILPTVPKRTRLTVDVDPR